MTKDASSQPGADAGTKPGAGPADKSKSGSDGGAKPGAGPADKSKSGADPEFTAEYVAALRKESAGFRVAAKENEAKAAKFDAQVESAKSDLQKAQERADLAEKLYKSSEVTRVRAEVAAAQGLPASMAARLQGGSREEMEADAVAIRADLAEGYTSKSGSSRESTGAGVAGQVPVDYSNMSPADLVKQSRERRSF